MKKIYFLIFLIVASTVSSICPSENKCFHGGSFDNESCTCKCFSAYYGEFCERFNCSKQSGKCGFGLKPFLCDISDINDFCPEMCKTKATCECGIDSCFNEGIFYEKNCACNCPPGYTGQLCEVPVKICNKTCNNGGTLNPEKCFCECSGLYTGDECEKSKCDFPDPTNCDEYTPNFCFIEQIGFYCPNLCGKCASKDINIELN
ncbi:multiple epidermal growth factor-like domains 6 [Brachionus plicatilis]|uniref:Multiple epidermal growth factor-like domains 6 n=1 Tax=Brachionus plicatilis TaxID=10195 RepID=A0A3M7RTF9_BRAPC|nr:multiple epidermal growth factor-like domains 6 [Brachionus plicatilis]